jgi:hypothetical protein
MLLQNWLSIKLHTVGATAIMLTLLGIVLATNVASAHTTVTIPADDDVTVTTMTFEQGDKVEYSYTAQSPVKYEITLLGGSNQLSLTGLSGSGQFVAPADGTYSFKFENQNPDASVEVSYSINEVESSVGLVILLVLCILGFLALIALIGYVVLRGRHGSGQQPPA